MRRIVIFSLALLSFSGLLYAEEAFHIVQLGETLSSIARQHYGRPVYSGKKGALAKVIELNPTIQNPNLIFPKQKIYFEGSRKVASVNEEAASSQPVAPLEPAKLALVAPTEDDEAEPEETVQSAPAIPSEPPPALPSEPLTSIGSTKEETASTVENEEEEEPLDAIQAVPDPAAAIPVPAAKPAPVLGPTPAPAQVCAEEPNEEPIEEPPPVTKSLPTEASEFPQSRLRSELGMQYFKISAHDPIYGGNATFVSSMSPQVRFAWEMDWSKEWTSRIRFSYASDQLVNTNSRTSAIANDKSSSYGFEAGAIRNWSDTSHTSFSLGSTDKLFASAISLSTISVDQVQELMATVAHEQDLVSMNGAKVGVGVSATVLNGGTGIGYTTSMGWGSDFSFYARHQLKNSPIEISGQAFYGFWQQNSDLVEEKETHTGVFLGVSWKFGQ